MLFFFTIEANVKGRKMAGLVEQVRRKSRQDAAQQAAIEGHSIEKQESDKDDTVKDQVFYQVKTTDIQDGSITEVKSSISDTEDIELKQLANDVDDESDDLTHDENFTLEIPKVEDDQWPDEEQYTHTDHEHFDTLF